MPNKRKPIAKILVVDDQVSILKPLVTLLRREGYQVILANGGAKGITLAQKQKPDLILLDIVMPDISGDIVLEEIKKRKIPTRIIMFTGYLRHIEDAIRFIKAGACDYLLKNTKPEDVVAAIKRALVLESAINLISGNPTPIIDKLIDETEKLKEREGLLRKQVSRLKPRAKWTDLLIRLIYIFVASLITLIFYGFHVITNTQSLVLLPVVIFILLLLPIERIRSFSAKHKGSEVTFETNPEKEG